MIKEPSLDRKARLIAMSAILYYSLDSSILSDGEFDQYSNDCADNWNKLTIDRKFALGSDDKIRISGMHVKASSICVWGMMSWYEENNMFEGKLLVYNGKIKYSKRIFSKWYNCNLFSLVDC